MTGKKSEKKNLPGQKSSLQEVRPLREARPIIKSRREAREIAMQILYQMEWGDINQEEIFKFSWLEKPVANKTREFVIVLVNGTKEHLERIDGIISKYSSHWTFDRLPKVELAILRFSIYSLLFLKEIPPIVIIDEAIELSKVYSGEDAWKYINGMLDAIYHKEILATEIARELHLE